MAAIGVIPITWGNTFTYLICGRTGALLVDTDYAGTLPAFYRAIKAQGIGVRDITHVMATHYHPDHMGLVGQLARQGVRPVIMDTQLDRLHFADRIFARENIRDFVPVDEALGDIIPCGESRGYLEALGIGGEVLSTPSHSDDSVSLLLDDGRVFAGDLEPRGYIAAYGEDSPLAADWQLIMSRSPREVYFAHRGRTLL